MASKYPVQNNSAHNTEHGTTPEPPSTKPKREGGGAAAFFKYVIATIKWMLFSPETLDVRLVALIYSVNLFFAFMLLSSACGASWYEVDIGSGDDKRSFFFFKIKQCKKDEDCESKKYSKFDPKYDDFEKRMKVVASMMILSVFAVIGLFVIPILALLKKIGRSLFKKCMIFCTPLPIIMLSAAMSQIFTAMSEGKMKEHCKAGGADSCDGALLGVSGGDPELKASTGFYLTLVIALQLAILPVCVLLCYPTVPKVPGLKPVKTIKVQK